jgi:hypothetical protein
MARKSKTLPQVLGIEDEDRILEQCLLWQITEEDLGDVLKKVMCSDFNSKEMLFAAFCIGKMQNADAQHIEGMMMYMTMRKMKQLIDQQKEEE